MIFLDQEVYSFYFYFITGVASQLWYVQGGKVNTNALNYVVIVPTNINILTFYWQNHLNSTVSFMINFYLNLRIIVTLF